MTDKLQKLKEEVENELRSLPAYEYDDDTELLDSVTNKVVKMLDTYADEVRREMARELLDYAKEKYGNTMTGLEDKLQTEIEQK